MPYAKNGDVNIYYEVEGEGPSMMLAHGAAIFDSESWQSFGYTEALKQDFQLILYDARGHGKSDKLHEVSAYELPRLFVEDMVAILDELDIDKTAFFGYSMGGEFGFLIPLYAPQRFNSLIIGGAAYPDTVDGIIVQLEKAFDNAINETPKQPMQSIVKTMEKMTGTSLAEPRRRKLLSIDALASRAVLQARSGNFPKNLPEREKYLSNIAMPCLIFAGEADRRFPDAKACAADIPGAGFASLLGLNHGQAWERSDLTVPYIKKFLSQVWKEKQ